MFQKIKDFFLRAQAETAINLAEWQNEATADTDDWIPSQEDRRRLAVAEVLLLAERQDGMVWPMQYGNAVLHNAVDESEVTELADATNRSIQRRFSHGMQ